MRRLHHSAVLAVSLIVLVVALAPLATAHARLAELSCPTHALRHAGVSLGERATPTTEGTVVAPATVDRGPALSCTCELRAPAATEPRPLVRSTLRILQLEVVAPIGAPAGTRIVALWRTAPKTSPPVRA